MKRSADLAVVMPVAPGCSPSASIASLKRNLPRRCVADVVVVEGRHPSLQRNLGARRTDAPFLYFLDHDSLVPPGTVEALLRALRPGVSAAGGPNLGVTERSFFGRATEAVLRSPLGSPLVSARYSPQGLPREAGEKELILCNLMVRRGDFLALGGFDPRLYPNEENEFLNRLKDSGRRAMHVPGAVVAKPRRYSLASFAWENFRNGRGRMEQSWVDFHSGDAVFSGILLAAAGLAAWAVFNPLPLALLPAYLVAVGLAGIAAGKLARKGFSGRVAFSIECALISSLIVLRHACYGAGLAIGALYGWKKRGVTIVPARFRLRLYRLEGGKAKMCQSENTGVGPTP